MKKRRNLTEAQKIHFKWRDGEELTEEELSHTSYFVDSYNFYYENEKRFHNNSLDLDDFKLTHNYWVYGELKFDDIFTFRDEERYLEDVKEIEGEIVNSLGFVGESHEEDLKKAAEEGIELTENESHNYDDIDQRDVKKAIEYLNLYHDCFTRADGTDPEEVLAALQMVLLDPKIQNIVEPILSTGALFSVGGTSLFARPFDLIFQTMLKRYEDLFNFKRMSDKVIGKDKLRKEILVDYNKSYEETPDDVDPDIISSIYSHATYSSLDDVKNLLNKYSYPFMSKKRLREFVKEAIEFIINKVENYVYSEETKLHGRDIGFRFFKQGTKPKMNIDDAVKLVGYYATEDELGLPDPFKDLEVLDTIASTFYRYGQKPSYNSFQCSFGFFVDDPKDYKQLDKHFKDFMKVNFDEKGYILKDCFDSNKNYLLDMLRYELEEKEDDDSDFEDEDELETSSDSESSEANVIDFGDEDEVEEVKEDVKTSKLEVEDSESEETDEETETSEDSGDKDTSKPNSDPFSFFFGPTYTKATDIRFNKTLRTRLFDYTEDYLHIIGDKVLTLGTNKVLDSGMMFAEKYKDHQYDDEDLGNDVFDILMESIKSKLPALSKKVKEEHEEKNSNNNDDTDDTSSTVSGNESNKEVCDPFFNYILGVEDFKPFVRYESREDSLILAYTQFLNDIAMIVFDFICIQDTDKILDFLYEYEKYCNVLEFDTIIEQLKLDYEICEEEGTLSKFPQISFEEVFAERPDHLYILDYFILCIEHSHNNNYKSIFNGISSPSYIRTNFDIISKYLYTSSCKRFINFSNFYDMIVDYLKENDGHLRFLKKKEEEGDNQSESSN